MTDLIDRAELIKSLNKVAMEHHESHVPMVESDFRKLICEAEIVDLREELKNYTINGYPFAEFILFGEACMEAGVDYNDLKNFSHDLELVYEYISRRLAEKIGDVILHDGRGD